MQHVDNSTLKKIHAGFTAFTGILCAAAAALMLLENQPLAAKWGLLPTVLVIGIIHAVFTYIVVFPFGKRSAYLINFIAFCLYGFFLISLIEASGNTNIFFRLSYVLFIFILASHGTLITLIALLLTWLTVIFTALGILTPSDASFGFNLLFSSLASLAGVLGWLTFRSQYVRGRDKEAVTLSKQLVQEQFKSTVIIESIKDGVMIMDTNGTVQVLNESAAYMLGWPKEEASKLDYRSLLKPISESPAEEGRETDVIHAAMTTRKSNQATVLLQTKNERQTYVDIIASPIIESRQTDDPADDPEKLVGVIAVLRNIDEQKRQEQQRSDFISTASHEMRTPVASIQGFIELALNPKVAQVDEKARSYLEKAHESTKHLGGLFQDLLTISQSEDGRLVSNPKLIEVGEILTEIVDAQKMAAQQKNLNVVLDGVRTEGKNVHPLMYIHVDPERLREVISNLFDNAVKYTSSGMITVGASPKERSVVIRISDTGMGVAVEDIPHLFQKFYRTDNSETREIGGTGLGLYICKQIVEMMNGKIWVESTVGAGSTFYVEIPRVDPAQVAARETPQP